MERGTLLVGIWFYLALICSAGFHGSNVTEGDVCKEENGSKWLCKKLRDCPFPQKYLEDESKEPPFCNFEGSELVVCCDPKLSGGKSERMCKKYSESVFVPLDVPIDGNIRLDTCGFDLNLGSNASPREYPHMALIGFGESSSIQWLCSGSLISETFVISSAQCKLRGQRPNWVKLGEFNRESERDEESGAAQPAVFEISEIITHPDFKEFGIYSYNDIALVRLNTSVQFNEFVRPVCLQTDYELPSQFASVAGWGRAEFGGRRSSILQDVNATIIPWEKCNQGFSIHNLTIIDESMVCAEETGFGGDICQVEIGGPLQQVLAKPYCMYSLVGTASFGSCGKTPGVYTRVSHFIPWIEQVVWPVWP